MRPGCLGEPGQAASGVPRRARRAAGALRGRTQARLLPPQLCRGTEGGRAIAVLIFFRTIRISVGNFCRRRRGAGEACGVVGRTPSPPSGRASRSAPLTWGTQHLGGAGARPALRYSPWGGGYPLPPRPGPWLLQCGGCGYARSTSQPRTAAVAAPRRPPPGRQRGAPPGRAAPLRSAPPRAGGIARPCLPA